MIRLMFSKYKSIANFIIWPQYKIRTSKRKQKYANQCTNGILAKWIRKDLRVYSVLK